MAQTPPDRGFIIIARDRRDVISAEVVDNQGKTVARNENFHTFSDAIHWARRVFEWHPA